MRQEVVMEKLRIALIGGGRIGRLHAENIMRNGSGMEIVTLVEPFPDDGLRELVSALGIKKLIADPTEVFVDSEIDAVLICSPTNTHADLVKLSAEAGKAIFCEKPVDKDLQKTIETMEIVKKSGVFFQIGFNRRYDHNFMAVRRAVESGKVGSPHILRITSRDPEPPPASYVAVSGGIFLDMMIHDFDMARFLMGENITEVFATGAVLIDKEIGKAGDVDSAIVQLKFESGALGVIDNSRKAVYGYDQRVEVFGSEGMAKVENDTESLVEISGTSSVEKEKPLFFFLERYLQAFIDELDAFRSGAVERRDSTVEIDNAVMALAAAEAAGLSLKEGRVVTINEILGKN